MLEQLGTGRPRVCLGFGDCYLDESLHLSRHLLLLLLAEQIVLAQMTAELGYRVAGFGSMQFLGIDVAGRVVDRVMCLEPIRSGLEQGRSVTLACPGDRGRGCFKNREQIVAVDAGTGHPVPRRAIREALRRRLHRTGSRDRPVVVLQHKQHGCFQNAGEVEGFVEISFGRRAFPAEGRDDRVAALVPQSPSKSNCVRELRGERDCDRQDPRWGAPAVWMARPEQERVAKLPALAELAASSSILRNQPV